MEKIRVTRDEEMNEYTGPAAPDYANAMQVRAVRESWTHEDCIAAVYQAHLLPYRSAPDAQVALGFRYINSAPEDYTHNAPWNNWTPPSKSQAIFEAAQARHAAETPRSSSAYEFFSLPTLTPPHRCQPLT